MNYPSNIKKTYNKVINYGNRGMDLEYLINISCENYIEKNIAIIYKKPTPIQVVKYDYNKNRITDAFYKSESTLDYNGIYKGYYVEFDAKNTNKDNLPFNNIADHQLLHMKRIINHNGICFLIIMIRNECYLVDGLKIINYTQSSKRKSFPYDFIKDSGIKLEYNFLKGVDFIPAIDILIKEMQDGEEKNC